MRAVVALYDVESRHAADEVGGWDNIDKMGFACGVIRWVVMLKDDDGSAKWANLAENVYWSPAAMVDDLLRPMSEVIVAYNGLRFDNRLLASAVVPEISGPYQRASSAELIANFQRRMRQLYIQGSPLVRLDVAPELPQAPSGWWERLLRHLLDRVIVGKGYTPSAVKRIGDWMELGAGQSRLIPAGSAGLVWTRERLRAALDAKTFDPLAMLADAFGYPHPVRLDHLREGLQREPFLVDGHPLDHAAIPRMYREGRWWTVVNACRDDVDTLCALLHQAVGGRSPLLFLNRIEARTRSDETGGLVAAARSRFKSRHADSGGLWQYHIPTGHWPDAIMAIAEKTRSA